MGKIRVLVADDHPAFRDGLCRFITEEPDMEVVGRAGSGDEAVALASEAAPDMALLDVSMPGRNGIEGAAQIKAARPEIAILIVSVFSYESYLVAALRAGEAGYVLKNAPVSEIVGAIRMVHAGEAVFDYRAINKVLGRFANDGPAPARHPSELQRRELEVLRLATTGASNP